MLHLIKHLTWDQNLNEGSYEGKGGNPKVFSEVMSILQFSSGLEECVIGLPPTEIGKTGGTV